MKFEKAYWISPQGQAIAVAKSHIRTVLDSPEVFGLEKSRLRKMYELSGEKIGFEGKARNEIILRLVRSGWIRMRFYENMYSWSITVNSMENASMQAALEIAAWVVNSGVEVKEMSVI